MKRRILPILFYIFIITALVPRQISFNEFDSVQCRANFVKKTNKNFFDEAQVFAKESQDELKAYLSDMNKIFIEVEIAIRNLNLKILSAKSATEQISASIEKFEVLKPPSIFSKEHSNMLSAFKSIRDGLKLFSEGEREKSVEMVKEGAALLKNAAIEIRTKAQEEGLIPVKPKTTESTKPILPSQSPSVIAGTSPTPSPHIASPQIEKDFITAETSPSVNVNLTDIPTRVSIPTVSLENLTSPQDMNLPVMLTVLGTIISIEPREDYFIVELKDDSENRLEIDVKPEVCSIMEDNEIVTINRINKGAFLYILYTQNKDRNNATFINILKPEDAYILKESIKSGSTVPATLEKPAQNK